MVRLFVDPNSFEDINDLGTEILYCSGTVLGISNLSRVPVLRKLRNSKEPRSFGGILCVKTYVFVWGLLLVGDTFGWGLLLVCLKLRNQRTLAYLGRNNRGRFSWRIGSSVEAFR